MRIIRCWVLVLAAAVCLGGCSLHFKGKETELDVDRVRVQQNDTFELEKIDLFNG